MDFWVRYMGNFLDEISRDVGYFGGVWVVWGWVRWFE